MLQVIFIIIVERAETGQTFQFPSITFLRYVEYAQGMKVNATEVCVMTFHRIHKVTKPCTAFHM
jgi:hypothetical protein